VFFRSSAVAVQALRSSAQLVFYSKYNQLDINPLSLLQNLNLEASNATEVIDLLKNEHKLINTQERLQIFNQFFTKLNYSILLR
jgi:hypothetical protein